MPTTPGQNGIFNSNPNPSTKNPPQTNSSNSSNIKGVTYSYGPDISHKIDFFQSPGNEAKPVVVFIHGGFWNSGGQSGFEDRAQVYLKQGYHAASINYRLVNKKTKIGTWDQQPKDISLAISWLKSREDVNTSKIALIGESAGGHLCLWSGIRDNVKCIISRWGPTNLENSKVPQVKDMAGNVSLHDVSPYFFVTSSFPPTFLSQGIKDTLVTPEKTMMFRDKLISLGVVCKYRPFNGGHQFDNTSDKERNALMADEMIFLNQQLSL